MSLENIDIPDSWETAAKEAARISGAVMILGASDAGKSTLARYLMERLLEENRALALVDCDLGQTTLGPPAAISMAVVGEAQLRGDTLRPEKMRFVGSTSPAGHVPGALEGADMMVRRARESGAEVILVDTDGMVEGHAAVKLKYNQVALIDPVLIFAIQREAEIEPLLESLSGTAGDRLRRLPASELARVKTLSRKRDHRRLRFLDYFSGAGTLKLDLSRLKVQGIPLVRGRKLSPEEMDYVSKELGVALLHAEKAGDTLFAVAGYHAEGGNPAAIFDRFRVSEVYCTPISDFRNRLVGLCESSGDCLALGTVKEIDFASMSVEVNTPLNEDALPQVVQVHFGSIKVEPDGRDEWIKQ